jgi:hypothetical protein
MADSSGNSYWFGYLAPDTYTNGALTVVTTGLYILKYDTNGTFLGGIPLDMQLQGFIAIKMKIVRNPNTGTFYFSAPFAVIDGDVASFGGQSVSQEYVIAAYSSTGQFLWMKEPTVSPLTGSGFEDISMNTNGDIYLCGGAKNGMTFGGHTFPSTNSTVFPFILKLNADGDVLWGGNAVAGGVTEAAAIVEGAVTGGYGGMTWNGITVSVPVNTGYDVFMSRFDPATGIVSGIETLQDDDGHSDFGTAITKDSNNNFYVGGKFSHFLYVNSTIPMVNENLETDFFLAKFGTANCDLGLPENPIDRSIIAWPSPTADILNISVPAACDFLLYDMLGKEIKHGRLTSNVNEVSTGDLPPGIYLIKTIDAQGETSFIKVVKK